MLGGAFYITLVKFRVTQNSVGMQSINLRVTLFSQSLQFEKKKDLSDTEDITFAMRNRQEWFNEKMAAVSPEIVSEVQLSADIIAEISTALGEPLIKVTE